MVSSLADSNVRPHDRFFYSDGSLYLLVENSLYCVHKFLFEIHATMFPVRELETSRNKPHVLGDVKKSDFDCFLAYLYPRTSIQMGVQQLAIKSDFQDWAHPRLPDPIPLSYEEGLRLGMEDVVNIYRIRHELYGSGTTPVPLEVAFAKVKEAGLGEKPPRQELEGKQFGSAATSQTSGEKEERGSITLTPPLDAATTDAATLVSERPEQRPGHVDGQSPSDEPTSVGLGNRGSDVSSSVSPGNVSDQSSKSDREGFKLLDEVTTQNSDLAFVEIIQWVNTKDIQTLHQITRLIVEKAMKVPIEGYEYNRSPYPRLCGEMVKYTQTLHQMTRLVVEKAIEEPSRILTHARLCNIMLKDTDGKVTADGPLFGIYLDEICQENPEVIAASVAGAGDHTASVRLQRLVEFIGALANDNADLVSVEIMHWVKTKDSQMLHRITRLIVEKAIQAVRKNSNTFVDDPFARLCKAMVKYTQTLHQITRLIVEKVMEETHRFYACAQLCSMMIKDTTSGYYLDNATTADGLLFGKYLGQICQENLEAIAASVAGAGDHTARIRRLRLVDFIRELTSMKVVDMWAPTIIDNWVTALLDANDEEKVATLCMVVTRAGQLCTSRSRGKSNSMNSLLQRVKKVAEETSKPRVRKLLQEVTKYSGSVTWIIAKPSRDCTEQ